MMPSSVIAHIDYLPDPKILQIQFLSGAVYNYLDVPGKVYNAIKKAASKGKYLNQHVKGHYAFEKVK